MIQYNITILIARYIYMSCIFGVFQLMILSMYQCKSTYLRKHRKNTHYVGFLCAWEYALHHSTP